MRAPADEPGNFTQVGTTDPDVEYDDTDVSPNNG
jgi:hypothetical protein